MWQQPLFLLVVMLLGIAGIAGFVLHHRSYRSLYRKLRGRRAVGEDYAPARLSALWASGCMGYITRLKREIGVDSLDANERALLRRAIYAYYLGVPAAFLLAAVVILVKP